ncbi:MAG: hypothetical protein WDN46_09025 [Methylocella sp.]
MKILTLSFAAAVVAASVGIAEAQQVRSNHFDGSAASQFDVTTGRSIGVQNQNDRNGATGAETSGYQPLPPARGPFQVY